MKINKPLSLLLSLSLVGIGTGTAFAVDAEEAAPELSEEQFIIPDIISTEEADREGYIGRVYEEENNLSTFVFKNSDGSHTMKVFGHPVKYEDENGKINDISLRLSENGDGSFSTAQRCDSNVFIEHS